MRARSIAVLAAALLTGGSTVVLAQPGYGGCQDTQGRQDSSRSQSVGQNLAGPGLDEDQGYVDLRMGQNEYNRHWIPGPVSPTARDQSSRPNPYSRIWTPGPVSPAAENQSGQDQFHGQSRLNRRALLRQELRRAGFQNIRILDAMFLVRASTDSGQQVIMVVNPSEQGDLAGSSFSASNRQFDGRRQPDGGQQFGASRDFETGATESQLSAAIMTPGLLDRGQIRSWLQSRGFSDISNLRQDGNTYTGTANWYGEQVDLRVDGRNGFVIEPSHLTPNQVQTMLDDQGWDSIDSIQLRDTSYRVRASRDGTPYNLWIDARTGEINRQTASSSGSSSDRSPGGQQ